MSANYFLVIKWVCIGEWVVIQFWIDIGEWVVLQTKFSIQMNSCWLMKICFTITINCHLTKLTGRSSLTSQPRYSATAIIWLTMASISAVSRTPFPSVSYKRNMTVSHQIAEDQFNSVYYPFKKAIIDPCPWLQVKNKLKYKWYLSISCKH